MAQTLVLSNPFLLNNLSLPTTKSATATATATSKAGPLRISCRKKEIHPEYYDDAKVFCNGEHVMTAGGTKKEYVIDVWSGNHPFYLGSRSQNLVDADQVEKFRKRFGELPGIMDIPDLKGEIVLPPKKKAPKKKK